MPSRREAASREAPQILGSAPVLKAWETANRAAHKSLLRLLNGHNGEVDLNVKQLLTDVANQVGVPASVVNRLPASAQNVTILKSGQLSEAQDLLHDLKGLMVVLFVMMVVSQNRVRNEASQAKGEPARIELQKQYEQIQAAALDPDIVKGVLLVFVKLCVLAAITLFVSTFSTSMVFNVIVSTMIFIAGHLVGTAKDMWGHLALAKWLLAIVPDLGAFNVADDIILGNAIPWGHVGSVALYGIVYAAAVIAAAHYVFEGREI